MFQKIGKLRQVNNINYLFIFIFFILLMILLFGRSFVGIYIGNFRLGEIFVGLSLFFTFLPIFKFDYFKNKLPRYFIIFYYFLLCSFVLSSVVNKSSLIQIYTFKTSSYIWFVSYIFFGIYFFDHFKLSVFRKNILIFVLIYLFILSTINYPNFLIEFFKNYSDKWDFSKASSIGLFFILTIICSQRLVDNKFYYYELFFLTSLFLPLFLFMSRGTFLAILVFVTSKLLRALKDLIKYPKKLSFIIVISFLLSSFSTLQVITGDASEILKSNNQLSEYYKQLSLQKDTKVDNFLSFYIRDSRLFTVDGNMNWRLQIWQDVLFDLIEENKLLIGYGYTNTIPAMEDPLRKGSDGLNENVHNFILNIIARGGLIQLFIFVLLYGSLFFDFNKNLYRKSVINFLTPIFIISFFDASMENAHFPMLVYFFLPMLLYDEK